MRKIEQEMVRALRSNSRMSKGNTTVSEDLSVRLHGHKIFYYSTIHCCWVFNLCGWNTVTTRSRINALLDGLNLDYGLFNKDFEPYLTLPDGNVIRVYDDLDYYLDGHLEQAYARHEAAV